MKWKEIDDQEGIVGKEIENIPCTSFSSSITLNFLYNYVTIFIYTQPLIQFPA